MSYQSRFICSSTAFIFLTLFLIIPYLPLNWVLDLYEFSTQKVVVIEMICMIPVMLFFAVKEKEWGYPLFLIIIMLGQIMFVHVFADTYKIASEERIQWKEKIEIKYYPHSNKA